MAGYGEVRPVNFFADFMAGRQASQQNELRSMQIDRERSLNALAQQPDATPEQYIRAGDAQTGAALQSVQDRSQANRQQAISELGTLAQRALALPPEQRKAFTRQIAQGYGQHFQSLGIDVTQALGQLDQVPDAELEQRLQQAAQFAPQRAPVSVAAGGSLVDPVTGRAIFNAPPKPNEAPSAIQEYEYAKKQGYKGSFQQFQVQMRQAGATTVNLGAQGLSTPPTGYARPDPLKPGLIIEPGGPADPKNQQPKPPTEGDKKNAVLYSSMMNAEAQIKALEGQGSTDTSSILNRSLGSNPITKPLQTEDFRKYESAALRWSANLLYLKSGATATPEEVESTRKQFFPQPGDGPEVKAQKEQARQQEIEAVRQNMVPGAAPQAAIQQPQSNSQPVITASGPNGQKLYLRNGQWVPK